MEETIRLSEGWMVRSLAQTFGIAPAEAPVARALVVVADRERRFLVAHALRSDGYEVTSVAGPTGGVLGQSYHVAVLDEDASEEAARLAATIIRADLAAHVVHLCPAAEGLARTLESLEQALSELFDEASLPSGLSVVAPSSSPGASAGVAPAAGCSCRRLLVVDDDDDILMTLSLLLEVWGYEVVLASDGREALSTLANDRRFAAILLDLRMPDMDGWAFRKRQIANPSLRELPVIAVTAERICDASAVGARLILRKPYDAAALEAALKAHATHCTVCRPTDVAV